MSWQQTAATPSMGVDDTVIILDSYNSDLHFMINDDGLGGCSLSKEGFANLWAAARATWGVKGGKYMFEVKVERNIQVATEESEAHPNALRVGWSVADSDLSLGEDKLSYGYGGTGRKSTNKQFQLYGESYGPGDLISCFMDLESQSRTVSFAKNGKFFGTAFVLEKNQKDQPLFPHVASKNVQISVNFSDPPWCEIPNIEGYRPIQDALGDHKVRSVKGPASRKESEVIMLVGLPAAGKTTWAQNHCDQNKDIRYTVLGTNLIMNKMKVSGLSRKQNYSSRWETLIKKATGMLNQMLLLASKNTTPRNYILDQTNVYASAQKRKISYFQGYKRKALIVIPPSQELQRRTICRTQEMGSAVPIDAINAMKSNFHIPKPGDVFDEVNYSEISGAAAEDIVRQYKEEARAGSADSPSFKRPRYSDSVDMQRSNPPSRPPSSCSSGGGDNMKDPYYRGGPRHSNPPPPPLPIYPSRGGYQAQAQAPPPRPRYSPYDRSGADGYRSSGGYGTPGSVYRSQEVQKGEFRGGYGGGNAPGSVGYRSEEGQGGGSRGDYVGGNTPGIVGYRSEEGHGRGSSGGYVGGSAPHNAGYRSEENQRGGFRGDYVGGNAPGNAVYKSEEGQRGGRDGYGAGNIPHSAGYRSEESQREGFRGGYGGGNAPGNAVYKSEEGQRGGRDGYGAGNIPHSAGYRSEESQQGGSRDGYGDRNTPGSTGYRSGEGQVGASVGGYESGTGRGGYRSGADQEGSYGSGYGRRYGGGYGSPSIAGFKSAEGHGGSFGEGGNSFSNSAGYQSGSSQRGGSGGVYGEGNIGGYGSLGSAGYRSGEGHQAGGFGGYSSPGRTSYKSGEGQGGSSGDGYSVGNTFPGSMGYKSGEGQGGRSEYSSGGNTSSGDMGYIRRDSQGSYGGGYDGEYSGYGSGGYRRPSGDYRGRH